MVTHDTMTALAWLYAGSGLLTNILYMPQLALLWRSKEARRGLALTTWIGWTILDVVSLAYAWLITDTTEMVLVAVTNLAAQGAVVVFIVYQLIEDRLRGVTSEAAVAANDSLPAPRPTSAAMLAKSMQRSFLYIAPAGDKGFGLFAAQPFAPGAVLVADDDGSYYDRTLSAAEAAARGLDLVHSCFQIDSDRYIEASGVVDDFINHACRPNAGIRLTERGYELIALAEIPAHGEISYDYSTYISRHAREVLSCACSAPGCRDRVSAFVELPAEQRQFYIDRGIVGQFIRRELEASTPVEPPLALAPAAHAA